jgi:hypothetical protein
MKRKKTKAEIRAEIRRELEEWPEHRGRIEAMYARWIARMDAAEEREHRRRLRLHRLSLGLLGRR